MRERITDEIFYALFKRKSGPMRRLAGWLFKRPTTRFSRIFAAADQAAAQGGLPAAGQSLLNDLNVSLTVRGGESLPAQGPLLVVSNHPGAYDSAALCSQIPRHDLKIIVYEIPFYRAFPHISQQMIFATDDTPGRMLALRQAVTHLQQGGAILQFGTGKIDPDPAIATGAERAIRSWLPSIEIMLQKARETRLALATISGVLLPRFADHPLTRLHRDPMDRRRLAEFMQIIQQLVRPQSIQPHARLTIAPPLSISDLLAGDHGRRVMPSIIERACHLLKQHLQAHGKV